MYYKTNITIKPLLLIKVDVYLRSKTTENSQKGATDEGNTLD